MSWKVDEACNLQHPEGWRTAGPLDQVDRGFWRRPSACPGVLPIPRTSTAGAVPQRGQANGVADGRQERLGKRRLFPNRIDKAGRYPTIYRLGDRGGNQRGLVAGWIRRPTSSPQRPCTIEGRSVLEAGEQTAG